MWLGLFGFLIVLILLVAGIALGGIFTLILIPVAGLAVIAALIALLMVRQSQMAVGGNRKPTSTVDADQPLPHSPSSGEGSAPTTPEGLVDARQRGAGGR